MLCQVCEALFTHLGRDSLGSDVIEKGKIVSPPPKPTGLHQKSWADLLNSAASKCYICTTIVEKFREGNDDQTQHRKERDVIQRTFYYLDFPGPQHVGSHKVNKDYPSSIGFHLEEQTPSKFHRNVSAYVRLDIILCEHLDGEGSQPNTIRTQRSGCTKFSEGVVKKWIYQCMTSHEKCNEMSHVPWAPTRLVDIGDSVDSRNAKIVVSPDLSPNTRYLTLSHCWGDAEILKLQSHNLNALRKAIPFNQLPKTFQDAFYIVRRLGFRYIWIDSLCIIQDSKEDWARESLLMNKVYRNSRLNIAATGADDSHGGCFFEQDHAMKTLPKVELTFDIGLLKRRKSELLRISGPGRFHLESKIVQGQYYLLRTDPPWTTELEKAKLLHRAWVFQERILSPRVVHFSRTQLFWECQELRASEACPSGMPQDQYLYWPDQFPVDLRGILPIRRSFMERSSFSLKSWARFIELYSAAGLTYPRDRLLALSGVATEMHKVTQEQYLAGLWKGPLLQQLLWYTKTPAQESKYDQHSAGYRAPSWSWASIEGTISMEDAIHMEIFLAKFVDAQVESTGENGTGEVIGGYIMIKGNVGHCQWKTRHANSKLAVLSDFTPLSPTGDKYVDKIQSLNMRIDFDRDSDNIEKYDSIYCLPILAHVDSTLGTNADYTIGLILTKDSQNQFRRIARFLDQGGEDVMIKLCAWPEQVIRIV